MTNNDDDDDDDEDYAMVLSLIFVVLKKTFQHVH